MRSQLTKSMYKNQLYFYIPQKIIGIGISKVPFVIASKL